MREGSPRAFLAHLVFTRSDASPRIDYSLMHSDKQKLAFWMMPSADAKPFFASLVEELARRMDAAVFEPHVTLRGAELDQQHAIALLEKIADRYSPVVLEIGGIELSEKYTKTLYVQFRSSTDASTISNAIADGAGSDGGYEFDPHLSLLYKTMPGAEKQELARKIKLPFEQVRFDTVKLVSVPTAIERPEDVYAWRSVAERPLTEDST